MRPSLSFQMQLPVDYLFFGISDSIYLSIPNFFENIKCFHIFNKNWHSKWKDIYQIRYITRNTSSSFIPLYRRSKQKQSLRPFLFVNFSILRNNQYCSLGLKYNVPNMWNEIIFIWNVDFCHKSGNT